jgi:gamma-glutamyltranspeptidase/glutathione hydrolase
MGHTVKSINGEDVGGVQSIMFVAAPPAAPDQASATRRLDGYYRAGSDFRKDGAAVGW